MVVKVNSRRANTSNHFQKTQENQGWPEAAAYSARGCPGMERTRANTCDPVSSSRFYSGVNIIKDLQCKMNVNLDLKDKYREV